MSSVVVNIILTVVIAGVLAAIVVYLYKAKKRGETCIGCPNSKQCSGKCNGNCGSDEKLK